MQKYLKYGNAKLYLYLGVLLVMLVLWRTGEAINNQLNALPVKQAPTIGGNAAVLDEKSFYPVWVKQAVAQEPMADDSQVDSLFNRVQEKVAQVKPLEPDYGQMFQQAVRIDGVADDGLFIRGHFYVIGAKLDVFSMVTSRGEHLVPKLESVKNGKAIFDVGARKIVIALQGKA